MKTFNYEKIEKLINEFVTVRNWGQFHSPKNLSMALNVEASELLEIFQWMSEKDSLEVATNSEKLEKIQNEMADIAYYLILLSSKLNINLEESIVQKMAENERKYPVNVVHGHSKKYDEY